MDIKGEVYKASRDGKLHQLKVCLNGKSWEEVSSLVSARTNGATPLVMACRNGHLDVVLHLIESCKADIEKVGSITADYGIIEGVPPLWCAAIGGHLNIVKNLVKYNASVNSTTENNSNALSAACSGGQLEIVKYLIKHGADIEIEDKSGNTCLFVACCWERYEITKYLLKCGANVNMQNVEGFTSLHQCAELDNLEIFKMLLEYGANNLCDSYGATPLLTAAVKGNSRIVHYCTNDCSCTKQEKINAFELLGTSFIVIEDDMVRAFEYWKLAMGLRYKDQEFPLEKPVIRSPIASCIDATEVRTLYQLENLDYDPGEMRIQALLIIERILGPSYPDIFPFFILNFTTYFENHDFQKCLKLLMHALEMHLKVHEPSRSRVPSEINSRILTLLSCFIELFSSIMMEDGLLGRGLPAVSFQDILHVFEINRRKIERDACVPTTQMNDNYISEFHDTLITAIHLVGLMCRLQPHLNISEDTEFKKAAYELVRLNPKESNGCTLLHLACSTDSSYLYHRFSIIDFPSLEVINLLLEAGACPNSVDASKNTPLHVVAMNRPFAPAVFNELLNHGAHLDLRNCGRKTALQLAEIMPSLDIYPMRCINLQCLCAQVIRKHEIAYEGFVHDKLKEFLDSH